jgi:hypothetical protein
MNNALSQSHNLYTNASAIKRKFPVRKAELGRRDIP